MATIRISIIGDKVQVTERAKSELRGRTRSRENLLRGVQARGECPSCGSAVNYETGHPYCPNCRGGSW